MMICKLTTKRQRRLSFCAAVLVPAAMLVGGCDSSTSTYEGAGSESQYPNSYGKVAEVPSGGASGGYGGGAVSGLVSGETGIPEMPVPGESTGQSPTTQRRIIYDTSIELVVKDYKVFESSLPKLVDSFGGFVSKSESNRRYQNRQSGEWQVRIPVDRYTEFIAGIEGLGFAESRREDAKDVTDQFVDIEARIATNRKLEERIVKMVEERAGKLSDLLEIERELARVRESIERIEGQLRLLSDRSAMATITIRCREEQQYTPPAAPTFASRISNSWSGSIDNLTKTGANLTVGLVALAPWLLTFCIPISAVVWGVRRFTRKSSKPPIV